MTAFNPPDEAQRRPAETARRAVAENEVRLKEARLTLDRTRELRAQGITDQAALDAAEAEVGSLEARISLAREQVAVVEKEVSLRETELEDTIIPARNRLAVTPQPSAQPNAVAVNAG